MATPSLSPTITTDPVDLPQIRQIRLADLRDALTRGIDDFKAMPSHVVFLSLIYTVVGLVLGAGGPLGLAVVAVGSSGASEVIRGLADVIAAPG